MEFCTLLELLAMLLSVALNLADGFSLGGPQRNKVRTVWPVSIDTAGDDGIGGSLPYSTFPQQQQHQQQQNEDDDNSNNSNDIQRSLYLPGPEEDASSYLFNILSTLTSRENNINHIKNSLAPFIPSTKTGGGKYEASMNNNNNNNDNNIVMASNDNEDNDDDDEQGRMINENDKASNGIHVIAAALPFPASIDNFPISTKIGYMPSPSKRQQGWYVQYGKRSSSSSSSSASLPPDQKTNLATPLSYQLLNSKIKAIKKQDHHHQQQHQQQQQHRGLSNSGIAGNNEGASNNFINLRRNLEQLENDVKIRDIAFDMVKQIVAEKSQEVLEQPHSSVKRQQGWFTQYGKRSQGDGHSSFS